MAAHRLNYLKIYLSESLSFVWTRSMDQKWVEVDNISLLHFEIDFLAKTLLVSHNSKISFIDLAIIGIRVFKEFASMGSRNDMKGSLFDIGILE